MRANWVEAETSVPVSLNQQVNCAAGDTFKQQTSNHPEQYGPNAVTETRLTGQTGSGTGAFPAAAETAPTEPDETDVYASQNQAVDIDPRPRGRAKAGVL